MTTAYWCVLVAALMPYVAVSIAKSGGERFDNSNPRLWLERQQGFRARANAAQANSFEAFPFFAAAVIVAHLTQAPQDRIDARHDAIPYNSEARQSSASLALARGYSFPLSRYGLRSGI